MDYEKAYNEALERAKSAIKECGDNKGRITMIESIFPELGENEDERIRKTLREIIIDYDPNNEILIKEVGVSQKQFIAWLEKQGNTNETINRDKFAQNVLRGAAINLITWIDYNAAEGNMCLSNMECDDIEDALVSGNWDKIYAYIKKKLLKQGEQKPTDSYCKDK